MKDLQKKRLAKGEGVSTSISGQFAEVRVSARRPRTGQRWLGRPGVNGTLQKGATKKGGGRWNSLARLEN